MVPPDNLTLNIGSEVIQPANVVRDLGVLLDSELSLKSHISKIASCCFYQLRRLRQIRRLVGREVTTQLVTSFILSRLDYCNSLLAGLPSSSIEPLQHVQNAAARLILDLHPRDHITPALKHLHWLPVEFRVTYKLCYIMHLIHIGQAPQYLTECVTSVAANTHRSGLRSASTLDYVKPRTRTKFRERGFTFSGPAA
jgi:hypothetical protein